VLEAFAGGQALTQIEIAQSTKLPYPTVWRILMTLIDAGVVEILPVSERYALTSRALALSAGFQDRLNLVSRFRPGMDALCRAVMWPLSLAVPAGSKMVVQYSTHSSTTMTYTVYQPGFATPLGQSAAGIAYLAAIEHERAQMLIKGLNLSRLEREVLDERIATASVQGYATYERTPHNPTPGKVSTLGVPIMADGQAVGTLGLSFFARAMNIDEAIQQYVPQLRSLAMQSLAPNDDPPP
jgi:IclR family mhp operon transcriptional activator